MDPMLAACPSFHADWEEFLREWSLDADPPLYLALGSLARRLIDLLANRQFLELSDALAVVERWHLEGDAYVREAATIGLLENLQNENLHAFTSPDEFEKLLMPESLRWWNKVAEFWRTGQPVAD